jgi:hypothetical protein
LSAASLHPAVILILQALAFVYCFLVPGLLLVSGIEQEWSWPKRLLVGFALSGLAIPMASFVLAWALGTNIQPWLPVVAATFVSAAAVALLFVRRARKEPSQ